MIETLSKLDGKILIEIQNMIRNSSVTPIIIGITTLGDKGFIWILLSTGLLISKKTRRIGMIALLALFGSLIINNGILKNLVARVRPYDVVPGLIRLIPKQTDFSFPSGHTASSFAAASVMFRKLPRKFGIPVVVLAVLIGFSRLYLGVHYPTDVLFGALSGILIGYLAEYVFNHCTAWLSKIKKYKESV